MSPLTWARAVIGDVIAPGEQGVLTGPFGASLGKDDFRLTGTPVLTIGCITDDGITLRKAKFVNLDKATDLGAYALKTGDLLFSRMASVGRVGVVSKKMEGALFNYHIIRLRLDHKLVDPTFVMYFLRGSDGVKEYLDDVLRGQRETVSTQLC